VREKAVDEDMIDMRKGFSLLELLVVIASITVLTALLVPAVGHVRASARRVECMNNVGQLARAINIYANDHSDCIPVTNTVSVGTNEIAPRSALGLLTPGYVTLETHFCPDSFYKGALLADSEEGPAAWGGSGCVTSYLYRHGASPSFNIGAVAQRALVIDYQFPCEDMSIYAHNLEYCSIAFGDGRVTIARNEDDRLAAMTFPPDHQTLFMYADAE
jgi:prepilin-type N-terminal cleavage/methylation domain-containing protein